MMTGNGSKQPRFHEEQDRTFAAVTWAWRAHLEEPERRVDNRRFDDWLLDFAMQEPHLSGIIASVVANDKNRGWYLSGGVRQVERFSQRLRQVEGGAGWRRFIAKQSQAYWNTDLGAITEVWRDDVGVLMSLYHVDSTRARMVHNINQPLWYYPRGGKAQRWGADDFFRTVSLPDGRENWLELGRCAVHRCLSLAKMMVALYEHDLEALGAKPPQGFLVGDNVTMQMYKDAKAELQRARENGETDLNIMVLLGQSSAAAHTDLRFVPFSTVPTHIESLEQWTRLMMYGYSLCFTYDAQEFYPVQSGSFGRGAEAQLQAEKAAGKGELAFILDYQDNIQQAVPDTVDFQFDRNDPKITLQRVQAEKAIVDMYREIYGVPGTEGGIDRDEFRQMLAEHGIIPPEWTEAEEDLVKTDVERARRIIRENDRVRRSAERYPDQPIVRFYYPHNTIRVLYESGEALLRRMSYPVAKPGAITQALQRRSLAYQPHKRTCTCASCQDEAQQAEHTMRQGPIARRGPVDRGPEPGDVLYESDDGDVVITTGDVAAALAEAGLDEDWQSLLNAEVVERGYQWVTTARRYRDTETGRFVAAATVRNMAQESIDRTSSNADSLAARVAGGELNADDWRSLFREDIKREYIRQYLAGVGGINNMTAADWGSVGGMLADQYRYLDGFATEIANGNLTEGQIAARARMYISSAREAYERANARAYGLPDDALPHIPGDGSTACLTNCKCYWNITEVRDADGNLTGWNCRWTLTATESCSDCIGRAGLYAPLFIAA